MNYLKHFNFYEDPFCDEFKEKYYFESKTVIEGLSKLNILTVRKGLFHLYAEPGLGKTILLKKFVNQLSSGHNIIYLNYTKNKAAGLLNLICAQLGLQASNWKTNNEKRLHDYFLNSSHNNILIIDEAQNLGDEALEELKLLCSGEFGGGYKFNVVLSSGPELKNKLLCNETIRQRLFFFYKLKPLDEIESKEYIRFRLRQSGGLEDIIDAEAQGKIFFFTKGVMREINKLATLCLITGFSHQQRMINSGTVEQVIHEIKKYQNTGE